MALVAPNGTVDDALVGEDALVVGLAGLVGLRMDDPMVGVDSAADADAGLLLLYWLVFDADAEADDGVANELKREEKSPEARFEARGGNGVGVESVSLVTGFSVDAMGEES